ncbi:MAG: hypothetical protein RR348_01235 [Clostridia bacterium]
MDIKSLERRVEENSFFIENIASLQKNRIVWELDCVDMTKNMFTFFCVKGKVIIEIMLLANAVTGGKIVVDGVAKIVDKNFFVMEKMLARGSHTIGIEGASALLGGKIEVVAIGARK